MVITIVIIMIGTIRGLNTLHESISPAAAGINITGMISIKKKGCLFNLARLQNTSHQTYKHQHKSIHTCRYWQWYEHLKHFSQKREKQNNHKLSKKFHTILQFFILSLLLCIQYYGTTNF